MSRKKRILFKSRAAGFTLIEGLIAFLVVVFGMLALAHFHGGVIQSTAVAKARTEALNFAQDKIEELRNIEDEAEYAILIGSAAQRTIAERDNTPLTHDVFCSDQTALDSEVAIFASILFFKSVGHRFG